MRDISQALRHFFWATTRPDLFHLHFCPSAYTAFDEAVEAAGAFKARACPPRFAPRPLFWRTIPLSLSPPHPPSQCEAISSLYMVCVAEGLEPFDGRHYASAAARLASKLHQAAAAFEVFGQPLSLKIGLHTGCVGEGGCDL